MQNFNITINLAKIKGSFITTLKGRMETKACVCIPLSELYVGKNNSPYLDMTAIEMKNPQFNTHIIKQRFSKDIYNSMTEEQRRAVPIVGSLKAVGGTVSTPTEAAFDFPGAEEAENRDDLPF
jgi:hypothetical protein